MSNLSFFSALAALSAAFLTGPSAQAVVTDPIGQGTVTVKMTSFAATLSGDGSAQEIVSNGDGTGRLFAATRNGRIRVISSTGTVSSTPYLDMTNFGINVFIMGEGGFAGLQFSPNFATNHKFYTFEEEPYNASDTNTFSHPEMAPAKPANTPFNEQVIREWTVTGTPTQLTTSNTSNRVLMRINHAPSNGNHQSGGLKFGSDGNLYASVGDSGGAGGAYDGSNNDNNDAHTNTIGNAQDLSVIYGKIIRFDPRVSGTPNTGTISANGQYGIPSGNPFAGQAGKVGEIYAYGLRNPYRISFDSQTGKLYAGDVGEATQEEVDDITSGGNYGWPFREGTYNITTSNPVLSSGRRSDPVVTPAFNPISPVASYLNISPAGGSGNAMIGGFVYRGSAMPQLFGKYIFGDLNGAANSSGTANKVGRIFYTDPAGGGSIFEMKYDLTNGGTSPFSITGQLYGFGEDASHELYAMFDNGQILQFVPEPGCLSILAMAMPLMMRRRNCK